ncbi:hypothetical protein Syun_016593 [Stephania yunnanensis]|uniref:Uncharacterized protein n=1 Tax=Stephania yunnanensis TaxID=152371 RepID=A0AAP0P524_9MAGN
MLEEHELHYKKIDACVNNCCLFSKENDVLDVCPKFHSSRWKPSRTIGRPRKEFLLRF